MTSFPDRVIDLFGIIHPLDRMPRAGYVINGVAHPESIAAHSHFVSLLAMLFLDEHPDGYDRAKALGMALIHDLSEARLNDIPMPHADAYLKEAKDRAEQAIIEDLFAGFAPMYAQYHRELTAASSPEARLVRGLDKVQLMLKVLFYERERTGFLDEFWKNPGNFRDHGIPEVAALFAAICMRVGRTPPGSTDS